MHLSLPSCCDASFSASSLLILSLDDLDFLSQESIFPSSSPPFFFFLADRDITKTRPEVGVCCGGVCEVALADCIVLSSGPGLAAAALILLSTPSKQRRNEQAICKPISSTSHYQTHARTNLQLGLQLLPTRRN